MIRDVILQAYGGVHREEGNRCSRSRPCSTSRRRLSLGEADRASTQPAPQHVKAPQGQRSIGGTPPTLNIRNIRNTSRSSAPSSPYRAHGEGEPVLDRRLSVK